MHTLSKKVQSTSDSKDESKIDLVEGTENFWVGFVAVLILLSTLWSVPSPLPYSKLFTPTTTSTFVSSINYNLPKRASILEGELSV